MAKSALEKLRASKPAVIETLDKDTPWAPAGATMVISSPAEIDAVIRRAPKGGVVRFEDLRAALAAKHKADIACPLTTGIFLNIAVAASGGPAAAPSSARWVSAGSTATACVRASASTPALLFRAASAAAVAAATRSMATW